MLIKDSQLASGAIVLLIVSSALLALALLGQAFTAGMAAIVNPQWWQTHVAWVHIFQWLVVIIPVSAAASSARRHIKWVSLGPLVLMGIQYVLAHRGME